MKRELAKKSLLLVLMLSLVGCFFAACVEPDKDNIINMSVWLDRYEEKTIEVEDRNATDYSWTSENQSVVTVSGTKLIAQSEGKTTVTGKKSGEQVVIEVTVSDSGAVPRASLGVVTAYVGTETTVVPELTYNGTKLDAEVEWTFKVRDTAVATVNGNAVTGVTVGETEITVRGEYKGVDLSAKATLTVKPYNFIEVAADSKEITLYNAKNTTLNSHELQITAIVKGEKVESAQFEFIAQTDGIVNIADGKVVAIGEGTTKVTVKLGDLTDEFTVTVLPNWVEETFNNTVSAALGTEYASYTGEEIGGRTEGLFRYTTTDTTVEGANYWQQRIVNTQSSQMCIDLYKNNGYRYFAFDMYVTKPAAMLAPIGGSGDTFYAPADRYFDVDGLMILADGKITNKLEANKWITVVYDLRQRILLDAAANTEFYLALHESNLTTYLSNIRYYLDDAFIPEEGKLSYENKDGYVQAGNGEFALYRGGDASRLTKEESSVDGVSGAMKLKGGNGDFEQNAVVIASSTGRTRADSIINLKEKGEYLTFDLYVKTGSAVKFSINFGKTVQEVVINKTDFEKISWLSLISGNNLLHVLKAGQWVTVSVEYGRMLEEMNVNSNDSVAILVGTVAENDEIYLNDARFYKDLSYLPENYADKAPAYISASKKSVITNVGKVDLSFAIVNGEDGQKPVLTSDSDVISVGENNELIATRTGFATITATFGDLESVSVNVRVVSSIEYKLSNKAFVEHENLGYTYAATYIPDSPEFNSATALKIKFAFNEQVNYFHIITTAGWGNQSNGVKIGEDVYSGFRSWVNQDTATRGFNPSELTILNEKGEVMGALDKEGVKWEIGETYTLILNVPAGEKLYFFTSDSVKDIEEYWWANAGNYYKYDILSVVDFMEFSAIYENQIVPVITADKNQLILHPDETAEISAFAAFARESEITYASENQEIATVENGVVTAKKVGKTYIVLSANGADDLRIPVSVVKDIAVTPTWGKFHEDFAQGAIMNLSAYKGYSKVSFNLTFAEDNTYLTFADGRGTGWAGDALFECATVICPDHVEKAWGAVEYPYISFDALKIKDGDGNYIDYSKGYAFKKGVTYTVEYEITDGRYLSLWTANNTTHGLCWSATEYYSNALEHITVSNVKGLWDSEPEMSVDISAENKSVMVGDEFTLTVSGVNVFDQVGAWASDNGSVAEVTKDGVVTAYRIGTANITYTIGKFVLTCTVSVCDQKSMTPAWGKFHEDFAQGAIMNLSAYSGYSKIYFDMAFAEDNTFLTITDGTKTGWATDGAPDNAILICPDHIEKVWGHMEYPYISFETLKIKDGDGNYIDYTKGYAFKAGVTYTVEYVITDGRYLSLWAANNAAHGLFWSINGYYTNALEHVTVSNVKGLWATEPEMSVTISAESKTVMAGEQFTLTATVINAFGISGVWASDNEQVAWVNENGVVTANKLGKANVSYTIGEIKVTCAVSVCEQKDMTPTWKQFHVDYAQGAIMDLSAYKGYSKIYFEMTFAEDNTYLTLTDGKGTGWATDGAPDNAILICPDHIEKVWGHMEYSYISFDSLKIKDGDGNYIDYSNGYAFKAGVTYSVEYDITNGRYLAFWTANNATHGIFWSINNYYSNALEHITVSNVKGLFTADSAN